MNKTIYTFLFAIFSLSFFTNCGSDDSSNTEEPSATLEQEREATTIILTADNNGVWRISEATLENSSGTFTISNNFNVVDDEFVFSGTAQAGALEWRQGNAINIEATSTQETLLDYYKSPENYSSSFAENSSTELTSLDGLFTFTVVNAGTITGVISFSSGEKLNVTLSPKLPGDYLSAPSNGLNFTEVFTFESDGVYASGMIGSYSDNSIFIVTREDALGGGGIGPERVLKWNLSSNIVTEKLFFNVDFFSKQLHIVNNELVVIGGQYVNTYPLDLASDPVSTVHELSLTRFGMAVTNNDAYIVGGDLNFDPSTGLPIDAEKIYKWNLITQQLSFVTDMPADRFGARSAMVNDQLYIFGGVDNFHGNPPIPFNTIFTHDLNTGTTTTSTMPIAIPETFVKPVQNLIYVAGHSIISSGTGYEFSFGVYDTEQNTYEDLTHNLPTSNPLSNIWEMCIYNNKMYVIYGTDNNPGNQFNQWSIMAADLN